MGDKRVRDYDPHELINEKVARNEKRINSHSDRLKELEKNQTSVIIQIDYLVKEISSLVSTIKWASTFTIITLVGFFIWYIQNLKG